MPTLPKLDWQVVAIDTMPSQLRKLYDGWRKQNDVLNGERKKMEDAIVAHLAAKKKIPSGHVVRFAYRWGKMSIAMPAAEEARAQGAADGFTF